MRKTFWYLFAILYVLWILDMITTYIGISQGYEEYNRFYAAFFSLSVFWTYIFELAVMAGIFVMMSVFFKKINIKYIVEKNISYMILIVGLIAMCIMRIDAIINNIMVI